MHKTRDNQTSLYMVPLKPRKNENMTEVKFLSVTFPALYTRPNQNPISAPFSISRYGARAHPH